MLPNVRLFVEIVLAAAVACCLFALPGGRAQAADLTESQITAILNLLTSFEADTSVVANTEAALRGTTATHSEPIPPPATCKSPTITKPSPLPGYALELFPANAGAGQLFIADQEVTYSAAGLPSWMTLSGNTVRFNKIPEPGTYSFTIVATNSCGASVSHTIPVYVRASTPKPAIKAFTATPAKINSGASTTLVWTVENTAQCGISPVTAGAPDIDLTKSTVATNTTSVPVGPFTQDAKYELRCAPLPGVKNESTYNVKRLEVKVNKSTPAPTCTIKTGKKSYKLNDTIKIQWKSTDATEAAWVPDTSGKDTLSVPSGTPDVKGSVEIKATVLGNPRLTLSVAGPSGSATCDVIIPVEMPVTVSQPAPTCKVQTDKDSYKVGETATISWSSKNATYGLFRPSVDNAIGLPSEKVATSGTWSALITDIGTYTIVLDVFNQNATSTCVRNIKIRSTVSELVDTATLTANAIGAVAVLAPLQMAVDSLTDLFLYAGIGQ